MAVVTGRTAYLRVYEPLAALPEDERRHWQAYLTEGKAPDRAAGVALEHELGVRALLSVPPRVVPGDGEDHAFVCQVDGLTYVCPWRLAPRAWEALEEFRDQLPGEVAEAFVPAAVAHAAAQEHEHWRAAHPTTRPAIRNATWSVPVPWFLLFEADERRLTLAESRGTGAPAQTGRGLLYVTAMSRARRRLARALNVVRRAFGDGPATVGIEDLGRWLEEFHPHSLVELDYAGLAQLLDDDALAADDSVSALAAALQHLSGGRQMEAGELYEQVTDRWRRIAALEQAN
jgi:hypothetical protein